MSDCSEMVKSLWSSTSFPPITRWRIGWTTIQWQCSSVTTTAFKSLIGVGRLKSDHHHHYYYYCLQWGTIVVKIWWTQDDGGVYEGQGLLEWDVDGDGHEGLDSPCCLVHMIKHGQPFTLFMMWTNWDGIKCCQFISNEHEYELSGQNTQCSNACCLKWSTVSRVKTDVYSL